MYLYENCDCWQNGHIAILEIYLLCNILSLFSVQNLRSKDGKPGSMLQIPISILKPAITGSY